jgi:hypothetical protein
MTVIPTHVYMTAQIAKNIPGGVTQRWNLLEVYLFLFVPYSWFTTNTAMNMRGVSILMIHWDFPMIDNGLWLLVWVFYDKIDVLMSESSNCDLDSIYVLLNIDIIDCEWSEKSIDMKCWIE